MSVLPARETARLLLSIVPRVMRTLAAELRAGGELPAPAHYGVLSMVAGQRRPLTLTGLAALQGVSLPTMSNTVTAMADHGWVRRTALDTDRRIVRVEVTPQGRAVLGRVKRAAEIHLAERLVALDAPARRQLQQGLSVLVRAFAHAEVAPRPGRRSRRLGPP